MALSTSWFSCSFIPLDETSQSQTKSFLRLQFPIFGCLSFHILKTQGKAHLINWWVNFPFVEQTKYLLDPKSLMFNSWAGLLLIVLEFYHFHSCLDCMNACGHSLHISLYKIKCIYQLPNVLLLIFYNPFFSITNSKWSLIPNMCAFINWQEK